MKRFLTILAGLGLAAGAWAQPAIQTTPYTRNMLKSNDAAGVRAHIGVNPTNAGLVYSFHASQFVDSGPGSVSIKDGALITNATARGLKTVGLTNTGTFTNSGEVFIGDDVTLWKKLFSTNVYAMQMRVWGDLLLGTNRGSGLIMGGGGVDTNFEANVVLWGDYKGTLDVMNPTNTENGGPMSLVLGSTFYENGIEFRATEGASNAALQIYRVAGPAWAPVFMGTLTNYGDHSVSGTTFLSGPLYSYVASASNGPAANELPTAQWVRSLLDAGSFYYVMTNAAPTYTNTNWSTAFYSYSDAAQGYQSSRSYSNVVDSQYIGAVVVTSKISKISGPVVVNAYMQVESTSGKSTPVHPEIYFSYDRTNWFGDYDCANQTVTTGTNLYQFVVSFPEYTATNADGFHVARVFKVGDQTGSADLTFHIGSNTPAHISFSVPAQTTATATNVALDDLTDVIVATPDALHTLLYTGTIWTNGVIYLDYLDDVEASGPSSNQVLKFNGTIWAPGTDETSAGGGITTLNGLTADPQTLAVGTTGTDFAISSATATHTFNLPTASAAARGALSSTDWSTFNGKQDGDSDLTGVAGLAGTGIAARTGAGTWATRALTTSTNDSIYQLKVSNGDGVAGNPTVEIGLVTGSGRVVLSNAPTIYNPSFIGDAETPGSVALYETDGTSAITLLAPDALAGNLSWTLPSVAPSAGQVLSAASGTVLQWADAGTGGGSNLIAQINGTNVGQQPRLNLVEGAGVTLTGATATGSNTITIASSAALDIDATLTTSTDTAVPIWSNVVSASSMLSADVRVTMAGPTNLASWKLWTTFYRPAVGDATNATETCLSAFTTGANVTSYWACASNYAWLFVKGVDGETNNWSAEGFTDLLTAGLETVPNYGKISISNGTYTVAENDEQAVVFVTRTNGSDGDVWVEFYTAEDTAANIDDFAMTNVLLHWADGETDVKAITNKIVNDSAYEGSEQLLIGLWNMTNGAYGDTTNGTVTITDSNDYAGTIQFDSSPYSVSEGDGHVHVYVSRAIGTNLAIDVEFSTTNGTAMTPTNYVFTNALLSWAAGNADTKDLAIEIPDDAVEESSSNFTVFLLNLTNGVWGTPTNATVTITDDDGGSTLRDGIAAYWTLDDDTSFVDSTNGHTLTINGTVTDTNALQNNGAYYVENINNYLSAADADDLSALGNSLSIAFWMNMDVADDDYNLISKDTGNNGGREWGINWVNSDNAFTFGVFTNASSASAVTTYASPTNTLTAGAWAFVVAMIDTTNKITKFRYGTGTTLNGWTNSAAMAWAGSNTTATVRIGGNPSGAAMDGIIDEVGIWTRLLTDDEITDLFNAGAGKTWPLD